MDEFETAIMLSLDPTVKGDLKENANRYCESVRTSPDAWKFCLDKIFKTIVVPVKFFCFQMLQEVILHRYVALSDNDRSHLKAAMLNWLREVATKQEDNSIKNKYAQIMALLMRAEYPDQWPTFFRDLLGVLNGASPAVVDVFLRVIKAIDEEVISHELQRSPAEVAHTARIKDAMREGAVVDLIHVWYELLSHHKSSPPYLIVTCLQTVQAYVGWIDVSLVVNEKFMGAIFELLGQRNYADGVVDCLYEIVCKGMEPNAKFNLLKQLNIKSIISATSADDVDFMAKVGKLVNTMGTELLSVVPSTPNGVGAPPASISPRVDEVEAMLTDMLALLMKLMHHKSSDVAASVLGFAGSYVNRVKQGGKVTPQQIEHLELFLQIIRHQAKYPTTFNFDVQDEEETVFLEFRKELTVIYRNILRIIPDRAIEFVRSTLTAVSNTPPSPFPDAEIALYLFYLMGEVLPTTRDPENVKATEQFFTQMMISLSTGPLSSHPHQCVTLTYFETIVRYAQHLPPPSSNPAYLIAILTAFMDARGLRHPLLQVRTKVAVNFRHFARAVRIHLFPYLDSIVSSLQELLVISFEVQKSVPFDDQVTFYESLGVLIGSNPDMGAQQKHTEALLRPAMAQLEEILSKELYKNDIATGKPFYTIFLAQLITVIGTFSKGFTAFPKDSSRPSSPSSPSSRTSNGKTGTSPPTSTPTPLPTPSATPPPLAPSRRIFITALDLVLRIPVLLPAHDELREKVFFYLHRMTELLGPAVYPALPGALALLLLNSHRPKDILEYITLVNQLISRFKEGVLGLINDMLQPFLKRMFEFLSPSTPPTAQSEEQRELLELQKSYYVFLQCVLVNNLPPIFTSPINAPIFGQILGTVTQGCDSKDLTIQKVVVTILKRMVEEWGGNPTFNPLIFDQIAPRLLGAAMAPGLNLDDAATNSLVSEIAKVVKLIHSKTGPAFLTYLVQSYLPSIQCPPEATQQFLQELDKSPIKQFTDFFKRFIKLKNT